MSGKGGLRGRRVWCAVSALDVFSAALSRGGSWPTVLRPASVAQRLDAPDSAPAADSASTTRSTPDHWPERGEALCGRVMGFADATPVRSIHWFLGSRGTLVAESAWGSGTSAVLVGWAPHDDGRGQNGRGQGVPGAAAEAGGRTALPRAPLPGALLLGVFETADTARRLAELVPESAHADIAVVGRWTLPDDCPPMSVHSVVHPPPGVLRRELITQLTDAFVRVQDGVAQEGAQTRTQDSRR